MLLLAITHMAASLCAVFAMPVWMQAIGDWVKERSLDEVLAVMGEARVPSGMPVSCSRVDHASSLLEHQHQMGSVLSVQPLL